MSDDMNIFEEYKEIAPNDYLQKIRFYEEKSQYIFELVHDQQYFLKYEFVKALFDLGRYQKVLAEIDDLIEYVFLEGASFSNADNFEELVFVKAASTYHNGDTHQAQLYSQQLLTMKPNNKIYAELLRKCIHSKLKDKYTDLRLLTILSILSLAMIGGVVYFKYGALTAKHTDQLLHVYIGGLIVISVLLSTFTLIANHQTRQIIKSIKSKKRSKKEVLQR